MPCGLIPEVVFNTIIEIINLYSNFYFCFVYFAYTLNLEFPKRTAYKKSVTIHLKEVYFKIYNPVQLLSVTEQIYKFENVPEYYDPRTQQSLSRCPSFSAP